MNLELDSTHDIIIGRGASRISGKLYTSQLVKCKLLLQLGEWIINRNIGIPWTQELLVKNSDNPLYHGILRTEILSTPNVLQCGTISINVDANRLARVSFSGKTRDGNFSGEV